MKLFKSLLVAPATLGLLAPLSATANDINLVDVNGYSSSEEIQNISEFSPEELAVTNSRVDGLEVRMNEFEAGGFQKLQQHHSQLTQLLVLLVLIMLLLQKLQLLIISMELV